MLVNMTVYTTVLYLDQHGVYSKLANMLANMVKMNVKKCQILLVIVILLSFLFPIGALEKIKCKKQDLTSCWGLLSLLI